MSGVSNERLAEWAKRGDDAGLLARELLTIRLNAHHDTHRCFICDEPFKAGQLVLSDVNEGLGHRACFGDDRQGYVKDLDTGEPLGADDPIPAGEPYDPADYAEPLRNAQSEAVAVDGEYAWGLLRNTAEAICKKLESESASVTIFDQSALRESLDRVSALTHPAPPLAVTDEMVEAVVSAVKPYTTSTLFVEELREALTAALEAKQ